MEQYSRGSRGFPAKEVDRVTGARVRIPPAPPLCNYSLIKGFFCFFDLLRIRKNVIFCYAFTHNWGII